MGFPRNWLRGTNTVDMQASNCCPSDLALERFLVGEGDFRSVKEHVAGCARCSAAVAEKESQEASYRRSLHAASARAVFRRAERKNARYLMFAVFAPLVALALGGSAVAVHSATSEQTVALSPSTGSGQAKSNGTLLEVRADATAKPIERELSLRGVPLKVGQGVLEGADGDGATRPFLLQHTDVEIE